MKNLYTLIASILIVLLTGYCLNAQSKYLHIGIGLLKSGRTYSNTNIGSYDSRSIPFYISGESDLSFFGLDALKLIRTGGYFNIVNHRYDEYFSDITITSIGFGVRVASSPIDIYNAFADTQIDLKGLDVYAGINFGYEIIGGFLFSRTKAIPFIGMQYLFKRRIGLYAEIGRTAYGTVNTGVSFGFGKKN